MNFSGLAESALLTALAIGDLGVQDAHFSLAILALADGIKLKLLNCKWPERERDIPLTGKQVGRDHPNMPEWKISTRTCLGIVRKNHLGAVFAIALSKNCVWASNS